MDETAFPAAPAPAATMGAQDRGGRWREGSGVGMVAGEDDGGSTAGDRVFMTQPTGEGKGMPESPPPHEVEDDSLAALKGTVAGTTEETQATLLLRKRKDMRMVDEALGGVKREFKERMAALADRQLRFEEKQRALQEMVAKFKPFIEENDAKRARAQAKEASEKAARSRLDVEVEKCGAELRGARAESESIERDIMRLKKYARYLEDVVSAAARGIGGVAEAFDNANHILARHKILLTTNQDLHEQADRAGRELEELRSTLASLQKRMRDTALISTSSTQDVRTRLESVRTDVADLTAGSDFVEEDVRRVKASAGQTDTSIRNLYSRVLATAPPNTFPAVTVDKSRPDHPYQCLLQYLAIIGDRINDCEAIVTEYPAWKEQQTREREALLRAKAAVAGGVGVGVGVGVGRGGRDPTAGGWAGEGDITSSALLLRHGHASTATVSPSASMVMLGGGDRGGGGRDNMGASTTGDGGTYGAAPSTTPGVFVVRYALPSAAGGATTAASVTGGSSVMGAAGPARPMAVTHGLGRHGSHSAHTGSAADISVPSDVGSGVRHASTTITARSLPPRGAQRTGRASSGGPVRTAAS